MNDPRPLIVAIERDRLEDGPGIRTTVFFKGCPLRCTFCQNPETQERHAEIACTADLCIACGACERVCPNDALTVDPRVHLDRARCLRCGACAEVCPSGALRLVGAYHRPEDLAALLLRDRRYYRSSGGGVTLSGGECTMFPEYLAVLLPRLRREGVHVALQTSGCFDWPLFERDILPHISLIHYDIKLADPAEHRRHTGRDNQRIIANLRRLIAYRRQHRSDLVIQPRTPLIPGITATPGNIRAVIQLLESLGAPDLTFLSYNPMGLEMAARLGRPRPPHPTSFMAPDEERALIRAATQAPPTDVKDSGAASRPPT